MKYTKALVAAAGVGLLAAGLLSAGPASADPPGGAIRPLSGVGSDTTQNVMNGLAEYAQIGGVKQLGSYNAGTSTTDTFRTKDAVAKPNCTYTRAQANGSGNGRNRLLESLDSNNAKFGCLDFSRSSSGKGTITTTTPGLTWIPFAVDSTSIVVRTDSPIPRNWTTADLQTAYKCGLTGAGIWPVLPQAGSGSRASWLEAMGITEAQISAGTYPCLVPVGTTVNGVAGTGRAVMQENDARNLKKDEIFPFSVGVFNTQQAQLEAGVVDFTVNAVLATIDDKVSQAQTNTFPITRPLYNIVPSSRLTDPAYQAVFVGPNSQLCDNGADAIVAEYGFRVASSCGDTTINSN